LAGAYGIAPEQPLAGGDLVVEMQQRLAAGDAAGVRAQMAAMREALGTRRPGDMDLSYVFPQAALGLALGDAAGGQEELDRTLLTLQALPYKVLDSPEEAGGLVGIVRLRLQLAAASGDTRTAAYWRSALSTLWANADPALKGTVK